MHIDKYISASQTAVFKDIVEAFSGEKSKLKRFYNRNQTAFSVRCRVPLGCAKFYAVVPSEGDLSISSCESLSSGMAASLL